MVDLTSLESIHLEVMVENKIKHKKQMIDLFTRDKNWDLVKSYNNDVKQLKTILNKLQNN